MTLASCDVVASNMVLVALSAGKLAENSELLEAVMALTMNKIRATARESSMTLSDHPHAEAVVSSDR